MIIGDRLRALREEKKLSQGDIEKRTGLLRWYISRVENGHTVPAIETLEKLARALECPLYQLFYDGEEPPQLPNLPKRKSSDDIAWGSVGKDARFLNKLRRLLSKVEDGDRKLILYMAQKMATLFRPSKRWRSWHALSSAHSINSFTTAKSRPYCRISPSASLQMISPGVAWAKMRAFSTSFVACWAKWKKGIASSFSIWLRRWPVDNFATALLRHHALLFEPIGPIG